MGLCSLLSPCMQTIRYIRRMNKRLRSLLQSKLHRGLGREYRRRFIQQSDAQRFVLPPFLRVVCCPPVVCYLPAVERQAPLSGPAAAEGRLKHPSCSPNADFTSSSSFRFRLIHHSIHRRSCAPRAPPATSLSGLLCTPCPSQNFPPLLCQLLFPTLSISTTR